MIDPRAVMQFFLSSSLSDGPYAVLQLILFLSVCASHCLRGQEQIFVIRPSQRHATATYRFQSRRGRARSILAGKQHEPTRVTAGNIWCRVPIAIIGRPACGHNLKRCDVSHRVRRRRLDHETLLCRLTVRVKLIRGRPSEFMSEQR